MHRLPYAIAALVLMGCATSQPAVTVSNPSLEGTWTWVESSGGKMGNRLTPKSEGYSLSATFGTNGRFVIRRDGTGWVTGRFEFEATPTDSTVTYRLDQNPSDRTVLSWTGIGRPPRHLLSLEGERTLVLDEGCCDRYRHVFRRDQ
ncbi:MAG: hypothetical protein HKN29_02355 [Rhodothermales bacterium]|nr:hypothetical protein [Rhodothermales bacterium]